MRAKCRLLTSVVAAFLAAYHVMPVLADDDELIKQLSRPGVQIDTTEPFEFDQPLDNGSDLLLRFTRAITGKPTEAHTDKMMTGVTELTFEDDGLLFTRCDNAKLLIPKAVGAGQKLREDWDKSKENANKLFGPAGREFLESIRGIRAGEGDRVQVVRDGKEELVVDLGERKLHRAFDLRGIRFRKIDFEIGNIREHPALMDIQGVTVIINAPGFTFPVEVKQFCKVKDDKGNTDVTVGVKNPVPGPLRTILLMPKIVHFRFNMAKKETLHS